MNRRGPQILVTLVFVATLLSAGMIQLGIELHRGEIPAVLGVFTRAPGVAQLRAYEAQLESESWLAGQLRPWMQYARFTLLNDPGEKAVRGVHGWLFYRPGLEYLTQRVRPDPAESDPVAAICDFRDRLAVRGIHLVVMPAPNKESIYPGQLTTRAASLRVAIGERTQSVLRRLRAAEVEVVDLFELYARVQADETSASQSRLYLAQDSHWSAAGVELAAQAVAKHLLDLNWLGRGTTDYATRATSPERAGDLLRMLELPNVASRSENERVLCRQVVSAATGRLYQDDPLAEVLVLGDSFLRIFQQDEPGGAGFVAHLARELKQPVTSLISDGGASTLIRQELYRRPALLANKRVVVWEFVERDIRLGLEGWQCVPLPEPAAVSGSARRAAVVDAEGKETGTPGGTHSIAPDHEEATP